MFLPCNVGLGSSVTEIADSLVPGVYVFPQSLDHTWFILELKLLSAGEHVEDQAREYCLALERRR